MAQAKEAAGRKAVTVVGGPNVIRQLLRAGLVDELGIDVMPVLLGEGLRFLGDLGPLDIPLQPPKVEQVGARTSLRFPIRRNGAP